VARGAICVIQSVRVPGGPLLAQLQSGVFRSSRMPHRSSAIVRGIEFKFICSSGRTRRGLVLFEVLHACYACDNTDASMVEAFEAHRSAIEHEARRQAAARPLETIHIVRSLARP
jgi:hypothetical protein